MSDLAPLANLQNLSWLKMRDTQVSDLTPLAELPNLSWLGVSRTEVSDLCPVAHVATVDHDLAGWDWAVCEE